MSEPDWELPDVAPFDFPTDNTPIAEWKTTPPAPEPPIHDGTDVDGGVLVMPQAGVDEPPVWLSVQDGRREMSSVISLIPVVGTIKDVIEGATGWDMISGDKLSTRKRVFNFAAAAADMIGVGRIGAVGKVAKGSITVRVVKAVGDGAGMVNDAEDLNTISPTF